MDSYSLVARCLQKKQSKDTKPMLFKWGERPFCDAVKVPDQSLDEMVWLKAPGEEDWEREIVEIAWLKEAEVVFLLVIYI